jgi:hypothetical protein
MHGDSPILVRGMHFRICADATLRGPDNAIAAHYSKRLWLLGSRPYRAFECTGQVYLRVTNSDGSRGHLGPYSFIKAADGGIFTADSCLGMHASWADANSSSDLWREVALLSEATAPGP